MKKLIMVLAISLFAMALVCATETTTIENNSGTSIITLTLNASTILGTGSLKVGFSEAAVTTFGQTINNPDNTIVLSLDGASRKATALKKDTGNTGYNVYWMIAHNNNVTVSLGATPLKPVDGNSGTSVDQISWTMKVGDKDLSSGNEVEVKSYGANTGTSVGSVELSNIATGEITGNASGNYQATLTLTVTVGL